MKRTLAIALMAFAAAGCGGGGGDGGGGGGSSNQGAAYDAAFDICRPGVKATAELYAVEPTKEAVTSIVVEQVSGGAVQDEQAARRGCTDALNKAESG